MVQIQRLYGGTLIHSINNMDFNSILQKQGVVNTIGGGSDFKSLSDSNFQEKAPIAPKKTFFGSFFGSKKQPTVAGNENRKSVTSTLFAGKKASELLPSEAGLGEDLAYKGNNKDYQKAVESHGTVASNLQAAIDHNKSIGKDSSHYQQLLSDLQKNAPKAEDFGAVKPSTEKVLGDVLGTGIDVASAFVAPGAGEAAAEVITKGLTKKAVIGGAKIGAKYGLAQGVAGGLQQDKSAGGVAKEGVVGGITGGITGGILGGAGAKIRNILSPKAQQQIEKEALDIITPKLTPTEKEAAAAAGRAKTTGSLFKKIEVEPDAKTKEAAKVVSGIVDKKKTFSENIISVRNALYKKAEDLKASIGKVNHPYTFKELRSKLSGVPKPISIKSDKVLSKQFDLARDAFMDIAKKNGGDISGLLDARKEFDTLVEKEFPNLYDKENAPMRNAITSMRNEVNDFIEESVPKNVEFKKSLREQSMMYHAIDNMATNAKDEIGTNIFNRFAKRNPKTATALGTAGALLAGEGIVKKVKDVFLSSD